MATETIYKISYGDAFITATRSEILKAASCGATVYDRRTGEPYKLAANWRGWCTLVTANDIIIHEWAGYLTACKPIEKALAK
jgi:hypothetical protein